ncbi:hypothetical protein B0H14DRAFT_3045551 [Mycena olivaceomarginata]|nr:hypothetical protein B0H14DRAFT_3045551 [Mycena olivaceomarginata]
MVSAWRRDVPRAGRRAGLGMGKRPSKKDISVRFYPECCVGGGLSGRTYREGGWGCESGVTSLKILGSVGERAINCIGSACLWCCAARGSDIGRRNARETGVWYRSDMGNCSELGLYARSITLLEAHELLMVSASTPVATLHNSKKGPREHNLVREHEMTLRLRKFV